MCNTSESLRYNVSEKGKTQNSLSIQSINVTKGKHGCKDEKPEDTQTEKAKSGFIGRLR